MRESLEPSEISSLMGLKPSHSHRKGDPHIGRSGRRFSDFSQGLWELRSALPSEAPLTTHLKDLAGLLEERVGILDQLRSSDHAMDIFIGVFDEGGNTMFVLEDEAVQMFARLHLDIVFDVYP
jgi:Domain of unknown function (DUF4279)